MNTRAQLLFVFLLWSLTGCATTPPVERTGAAISADSMQAVVQRSVTAYGFVLKSGQVLREMTLAFETYGRLAPDGRNAPLISPTRSRRATTRLAGTRRWTRRRRRDGQAHGGRRGRQVPRDRQRLPHDPRGQALTSIQPMPAIGASV